MDTPNSGGGEWVYIGFTACVGSMLHKLNLQLESTRRKTAYINDLVEYFPDISCIGMGVKCFINLSLFVYIMLCCTKLFRSTLMIGIIHFQIFQCESGWNFL